jgi:general secretion pathway protein E
MSLQAFSDWLAKLNPSSERYATEFADALVGQGILLGASDIHVQPRGEEIEVSTRIDGVLHAVGTYSPGKTSNVVSRLKVLAELPTYRADVPQEGRITGPDVPSPIRVSTFPTVHGERAALRFFGADDRYRLLWDLGFPQPTEQILRDALIETSGMILLTGPAGSGKTTTLYACLREIACKSGGGRHVVTLEDPVEAVLPGVSQSRVRAENGFDMASATKALLRQDPDVIAYGEIRDAATASIALQAAQTGHLVLATFHAGSASEAVGRLLDMALEVYMLRNGLRVVLSQRLVRVLCDCKQPCGQNPNNAELPVESAWMPVGCTECRGTGYQGRRAVVEILPLWEATVRSSIVRNADNSTIGIAAVHAGMKSCREQALDLVRQGTTSVEEFHRVFGFTGGNVPANE